MEVSSRCLLNCYTEEELALVAASDTTLQFHSSVPDLSIYFIGYAGI